MKPNLFIVGAGGFAKEVLWLIDEIGHLESCQGFLEPDIIWQEKWKNETLLSKRVLPYSQVSLKDSSLVIAIGSPSVRRRVAELDFNGGEFKSLIHPNARISKWVDVGEGSIITAGCIITVDIEIGIHAQLNLDCTVGHNTKIGDYFTAAPSVNISGDCNIGNQVYMGTGSAIKQGVSICDNVVIGMGAMVTKDIVEPGTYVGIPARRR